MRGESKRAPPPEERERERERERKKEMGHSLVVTLEYWGRR